MDDSEPEPVEYLDLLLLGLDITLRAGQQRDKVWTETDWKRYKYEKNDRTCWQTVHRISRIRVGNAEVIRSNTCVKRRCLSIPPNSTDLIGVCHDEKNKAGSLLDKEFAEQQSVMSLLDQILLSWWAVLICPSAAITAPSLPSQGRHCLYDMKTALQTETHGLSFGLCITADRTDCASSAISHFHVRINLSYEKVVMWKLITCVINHLGTGCCIFHRKDLMSVRNKSSVAVKQWNKSEYDRNNPFW